MVCCGQISFGNAPEFTADGVKGSILRESWENESDGVQVQVLCPPRGRTNGTRKALIKGDFRSSHPREESVNLQ